MIATRHSKQMPIPHNGPRGSPVTDFRQACPAIAIATATVAPGGATTAAVHGQRHGSGMDVLLRKPRRQIWFDRNRWLPTCDLVGHQARGSQRGGNSQSFVTGRQKQCGISRRRPDERQLVRASPREILSRRGSRTSAPSCGMYSCARCSMRARITVSTSTSLSSAPYWRDDPIRTCPVWRGCTLNATESAEVECALFKYPSSTNWWRRNPG